MKPLNRQPSRLTPQQLAAVILACDGINNFQVGIFERKSNTHIGNFYIGVDAVHQSATLDVLIGDTGHWGNKVVNECRAALLDHFFRVRGVEKMIGRPLTRNIPSVFNYKTQGWRLEGVLRSHWKSFFGEGRLDQYQFSMLKDEWRDLQKANLHRADRGMADRRDTSRKKSRTGSRRNP